RAAAGGDARPDARWPAGLSRLCRPALAGLAPAPSVVHGPLAVRAGHPRPGTAALPVGGPPPLPAGPLSWRCLHGPFPKAKRGVMTQRRYLQQLSDGDNIDDVFLVV